MALSLTSTGCDSDPSGPHDPSGPEPAEVTLQFIQRLPSMDYVWGSQDPSREGWPEQGQMVTWRAHLRNWFQRSVTVEYAWLLDGVEVARGETDLSAGGGGFVDLPWTWTFQRHRLAFVLDPGDRLDEESEQNNTLTVFTDALGVAFYVEQGLYDFFRDHQHRLGNGFSTSWEDWAQRNVAYMNQLFEEAVYPDTPEGVLDRVRIDGIHIVSDGSITNIRRPNDADRSVDMIWGFRAEEAAWCTDLTNAVPANYFYLSPTLSHELGHARYLVDTYAQDVAHDPDKGMVVGLMEGGEPVVDSPFMPVAYWTTDGKAFVHVAEQIGLMNRDYTRVDPYSAMALNLIAGHRATRGNYNDPENLGSFMNDLPTENRVVLRDQHGQLLSGATVEVYRSGIFPDPEAQRLWKQFDDVPDQAGTTFQDGSVLLGRNPFGGAEPIDRWNWSNTVIILRVQDGLRVGYSFLESLPFNMEFWRGHTELGQYDLTVNMVTP